MSIDPLFDFTGKVAVVTGGSRGLGREMVLAFAERGADVVIASRKIDACEELARQVRAMGRRALAVACHVAKWDDCNSLFDAAYTEFDRIDILVNNAGMSPLAPSSVETSEDLYDKIMAVNFKGPFRLQALFGQRMFNDGGGCIINVSSTGALIPMPRFIPYAGAKAALNASTIGFAKEFAPRVRVNTLSAGPFLTDIANAWAPEARERSHNYAGRPGQPHEVVTAALMLASPSSSYVTGALLQVDGGLNG